MPEKQTLSVTELRSLIRARFKADQERQEELRRRINKELGNETQAEKPEEIAIADMFANRMCDVLARRLKQNQHTTPLLSSRDFTNLVPLIINEATKVEGNELEAKDRKMYEQFINSLLENIIEMMHAMVPPRKNPYEEYWRWTTTVLDLAAERNILPTELLALEDANDEIMRRLFTKRQFIALSKQRVSKFVNADVLKKLIFQPILDILSAESDEEELHEIEQALETELMPQLREMTEKTKMVVNAWRREEIERIYATT